MKTLAVLIVLGAFLAGFPRALPSPETSWEDPDAHAAETSCWLVEAAELMPGFFSHREPGKLPCLTVLEPAPSWQTQKLLREALEEKRPLRFLPRGLHSLAEDPLLVSVVFDPRSPGSTFSLVHKNIQYRAQWDGALAPSPLEKPAEGAYWFVLQMPSPLEARALGLRLRRAAQFSPSRLFWNTPRAIHEFLSKERVLAPTGDQKHLDRDCSLLGALIASRLAGELPFAGEFIVAPGKGMEAPWVPSLAQLFLELVEKDAARLKADSQRKLVGGSVLTFLATGLCVYLLTSDPGVPQQEPPGPFGASQTSRYGHEDPPHWSNLGKEGAERTPSLPSLRGREDRTGQN